MRKLLIIAILAGSAVPVAAQSQQAAQPASQKAKAKDPLDKMICQREEEIGSRLGGRKVCMTARQWKEQRDVQRSDFEKVQQVVNQRPSG